MWCTKNRSMITFLCCMYRLLSLPDDIRTDYTLFVCSFHCCFYMFFFFFQAEDGIRDYKVTGVQTCALPISGIAAHAGRAMVDRETAKAADFDAMASHQGIADGVKNRLDGLLGIALAQLAKAGGEFFDEIGSGHQG